MKKLNKFISDSGYCSRREADTYISQGRVMVNGVEAQLGSSVEEGDLVEVDGERVGRAPKRRIYIAFNKPVGVTSTTDKDDKTNIVDYIRHKERIFNVGRLDKDSEGLIILTNDGDIVNKILRAGNNNPKEYVVTVDTPITSDFVGQMSKGVRILGTVTKPCKVVKKSEKTFIIHLTQGLNRQIRRMCQVLGYKVTSLKRLKVMNISLGNLGVGEWRYFTPEETTEMQRLLAEAVGTEEASKERAPKAKGSYADYRKQGRQRSTGEKSSRPGAPKKDGGRPSASQPKGKGGAVKAAPKSGAKPAPAGARGVSARPAGRPAAKQGGRGRRR